MLTAQKWLAHADAKTTLSIYAYLSQECELQNAEKLNAVFTRVSTVVKKGEHKPQTSLAKGVAGLFCFGVT